MTRNACIAGYDVETGPGPLVLARAHRPRALTVASCRWPLATPTARANLRLADLLWHPRRRLPAWLCRYLLIELPLPNAAVPTVPSPFRDGLASIPSALAVQGALVAIHHAGPLAPGWSRAPIGQPAFSYRKRGGTIVTSAHPAWESVAHGQGLVSSWDAVRNLSDLDGDVLLCVLAHALDRRDADGAAWISADAILDDRGIRPKTERAGKLRYRAGHRREDRARVAAAMERLGRLRVQLRDVTLLESRADARPRSTRYTHEDRLLVIRDRLVHGGIPVAWRVAPGPWLAPFLTRPNRQVALLARQALRYDPYHERWEKRLARYFTFHLRMDARRAAPLIRRVGPLLDELNLPTDRRHPERTRTRFEAALDRLVRDGVIGAWDYTPAARDRLAALPARGWLDRWRDATIAVTPSPAIAARYASLACGPRLPSA